MRLAFSMENLTERLKETEREGELCELKIDSGRVVVMIASPHNNPSVGLVLLHCTTAALTVSRYPL